jgi:hypothetical protein
LFLDRSDLNAVNQTAGLDGLYLFNRLSVSGGIQWERIFTTNRDLGGRVEQSVVTASGRWSYRLGERVLVEASAQVWNRDFQSGVDSFDLLGRLWFVYGASSRLDASLGGGLGYLEVSNGLGQPYQQLLLRARFESTQKLSFTALAGGEFRQFESGRSSRATPVFDLTGTWRPMESLVISVAAYRRVTNSASLAEENYTSTGVSVLGRQGIIGKLSAELSAGYERAVYSRAGGTSPASSREDDYAYGRVALLYSLQNWSELSVFHGYRNNDSNIPGNSFANHQTGVEWKVSF